MDKNVQTEMFSNHVSPILFVSFLPDPAPLPQILVKSTSITPGWCNATLECTASRDTEDLKVTWGSMGLPREQRIMLDPPSDPWTLTLSLPLSQPSASLTCVVSNQVDQKTATLDLGEVCVSGECARQRWGHCQSSGVRLMGFSPHHVISPTF